MLLLLRLPWSLVSKVWVADIVPDPDCALISLPSLCFFCSFPTLLAIELKLLIERDAIPG